VSGGDLAPRDARDRLIVALDLPSVADARRMVETLGASVSFYKVGMQLVFAGGLSLVEELVAAEKRVFLDMKLLDIDNTVAGGVGSIARLGVTLTTIHAYPNAMRAAVAALGDAGGKARERLGLLAVTVLTSLNDGDLERAGYAHGAEELVRLRAADARQAGMAGIVCAPNEAAAVRAIVGPDMLIVTPGIRPAGSAAGDQKRVMVPGAAISAGADYIVVGRPVTAAAEPAAAAAAITAEVDAALR